MASPLLLESVWFDKYKYDDAERNWQEHLAKNSKGEKVKGESVNVVSLGESGDLSDRVRKLEKENDSLTAWCQDLQSLIQKLDSRIAVLEGKNKVVTESVKPINKTVNNIKPDDDDDDDDIDLFGSDEEDEKSSKAREQVLKAYAEKKSKKKAVIAKSSVVLDVKPWDDETDLAEMEKKVREIQSDGLQWGASKRVPLAYGIYKLQIVSIVEDEKVSIDWLVETIQEIEDYVQSVDIAAFNKL
ncbi:elongation factor 1-delta-like isoform X2 [Centruroides sculpturatus]|uniref:elongation factor 1-delta-like isoform X2 n=1 Tax=Centruroides sculpturatus TaxID=218467 RepID=UPI000C6D2F40|nr:elongation factor 1-delta-like isoform X2 [Centruroides sculpturatus]XP_023235696.1 elongation factor 1-delta-like isoform X2 [Centruroides sculpturatus]